VTDTDLSNKVRNKSSVINVTHAVTLNIFPQTSKRKILALEETSLSNQNIRFEMPRFLWHKTNYLL